jgi:hypothetical protein
MSTYVSIYRNGRTLYLINEDGDTTTERCPSINAAKARSRPYHNMARLSAKQSIVKCGKPPKAN